MSDDATPVAVKETTALVVVLFVAKVWLGTVSDDDAKSTVTSPPSAVLALPIVMVSEFCTETTIGVDGRVTVIGIKSSTFSVSVLPIVKTSAPVVTEPLSVAAADAESPFSVTVWDVVPGAKVTVVEEKESEPDAPA